MTKKLSIITINYNNAAGLRKTVESVARQTFTDLEYIVVDGASKDGSVDVLKEFDAKISWWCSEKDSGIYQAMNKGIRKATGEYCLFLNSGDYLYQPDTLEKVFAHELSHDIEYGDMMIDYGNGNIVAGTMPDQISFHQMYTDTLWHPVSFIKRTLFEKLGMYDETYKMVADYEFFFRAIIMYKVSTRHIVVPVSVYNLEGFSSKPEFKPIEREERRRVLTTHLPEAVIAFADAHTKPPVVQKPGLLTRIKNKLM